MRCGCAVCDELISGAATNVEEAQLTRRCTLLDERQELWIDRSRPIRLRVIQRGNSIVVYAW
jgi:hypothetical protein